MKHLFLAFSVEIQQTENKEVVLAFWELFSKKFWEEWSKSLNTGELWTAGLGTNSQYGGFDKKLNVISFEDSTACSYQIMKGRPISWPDIPEMNKFDTRAL